MESWFELGTMYRISLSFFLSIVLVAACTTCAGFDDSIERELKPIVLQIAASDRALGTSQTFR